MSIDPVYRCLLEIAKERGVDTRHILAELGFTEETVLAPEARLSPEVGRTLAATLVRETGDPELGLCAAERFQIADLDLLGYVLWHVGTLGALFDTIAQYARLLGDTAECTVEREAGLLVVTLGRSGGRVLLPEGSDSFVGAITRTALVVTERSANRVSIYEPK